jgi:hypothetical protein
MALFVPHSTLRILKAARSKSVVSLGWEADGGWISLYQDSVGEGTIGLKGLEYPIEDGGHRRCSGRREPVGEFPSGAGP